MSCALRALRKAKSLIKEVTANSVLTFNAKVAGKVPLERDPDKKKRKCLKAQTKESHPKESHPVRQLYPMQINLKKKAIYDKNHVKRHSEMGQITLVMFRCKYCSCMSTARKLVYDHQGEKHPGKPIALVKKIVAIDTTDVDKSFAETSVEETFEELEENIQKELANPVDSNDPFDQDTSDTETVVKSEPSSSNGHEQLFVIPEGGDTFNVPLQCPKCSFSTYKKREIVEHVATHPEIKIVGSDPDVQRLVSAGPKRRDRSPRSSPAAAHSGPLPSQEQVLIVPDEQNFKEPALCSRCSFQTMQRKEMVLHLQQNHPEISVIGRNSYHIQVSCWLHSKKIIRI